MPKMKLLPAHTGTALIFGVLLCACGASSQPLNAQAPSPLSTSLSSNTSATTPAESMKPIPMHSLLKKNMAYADAREALQAQGWTPDKDADCRANMGADDTAKCDAMPELSIYSDQGVLMTHFRCGQKRLTVSSYGMFSDWKVSGVDSRLRVTDWQISIIGEKNNPTTP